MRFVTSYGTGSSVEKQQHAEEREAKRWLQTRLDNAYKIAVKYEPQAAEDISVIAAGVKGHDMMAMKPETRMAWTYRYDFVLALLTVERMP